MADRCSTLHSELVHAGIRPDTCCTIHLPGCTICEIVHKRGPAEVHTLTSPALQPNTSFLRSSLFAREVPLTVSDQTRAFSVSASVSCRLAAAMARSVVSRHLSRSRSPGEADDTAAARGERKSAGEETDPRQLLHRLLTLWHLHVVVLECALEPGNARSQSVTPPVGQVETHLRLNKLLEHLHIEVHKLADGEDQDKSESYEDVTGEDTGLAPLAAAGRRRGRARVGRQQPANPLGASIQCVVESNSAKEVWCVLSILQAILVHLVWPIPYARDERRRPVGRVRERGLLCADRQLGRVGAHGRRS